MTETPPNRRAARAADEERAARSRAEPGSGPTEPPEPTAPHDPVGVDHVEGLFSGPAVPDAPERSSVAAHSVAASSGGAGRGGSRGGDGRGGRARRSRKGLWGGLVALGVFLALVAVAVVIFIEPVKALFAEPESADYQGTGTGEVVFTIHEGDTGDDIATNLVDAGVIKSYSPFYSLLLSQSPEPVFQPGAYRLAGEMSAKSALAALLDSETTRLANTFVIPEGTALQDVLPLIADGIAMPLADLQAAAADYGSYGLPAEATSLEGFLFPATYDVDPGTSARDVLQTLVNRTFQSLDAAGVAEADRYRTIVFASLVQREAGLASDFPKVARVFQNRLDQGWRMQSDATVAYGTGNTHRVTTTDAERADESNPYNTYLRDGLPPGPISNPGDVAIQAVIDPAEGTWLFFVTTNLDTGETVFSTTIEEHDAAVAVWQAWMRDHPEYQ